MHCVNAIEESLGTLENNHPCLLAVRKVARTVDRADLDTLEAASLDQLVDRLQLGLMSVHDTIARMYFLPSGERV